MGSNDEHFVYAMQLVADTSFPMVLETVIKLKVLEAIAEAGPDAQLTAQEIVSRLLIPNKDAPDMVDRILRLLASYSIVTCTEGVHESRPVRLYGLTPVAKYFIPDEDGASLSALVQLNQDKWVLHNWSDDHCVKLLKNCNKALPVDGNVIIVEAILPFVSDTSSSTKLSTQMDVKMMAFLGGMERTEDEFVALTKGAGFIGITKKCFVCNYWVMELYK
ncbi:hypothetical protein L1987_23737 [Smallanthus sonchifolius]|uniref:Uncharacterized protein n=1 Tax=Smallanthus sonchifolius TaxID=185202 RepID=A0ACB9IHQ9_9ASTR|nr:hypothetical protein L1987_23737 [Smallanthus sonchifolius]